MITTIDEAGRLVIPREVRRAAGLEPGMPLEVRVDDGAVMIEPAPTPVAIERRGRFVVARPARPVPPLTDRTVQETRERLTRSREYPGPGNWDPALFLERWAALRKRRARRCSG